MSIIIQPFYWKKNKVSYLVFFSECEEIPRKLLIFWHLLMKHLMENFSFSADFRRKFHIHSQQLIHLVPMLLSYRN